MEIKNKFSDMYAEVDTENGWVILKTHYGDSIILGKYPNARFRIIEEMLEGVKKLKEKKFDKIK